MSANKPADPKALHVRRVLLIGLVAILIVMSVALVAGAISTIVSSKTRVDYQADQIPVVHNLVIPILVLTPLP
jgi:hypothetical protein